MTTVNQYNKTLSEFLTKLINIFPVTKADIMKHYSNLLNGEDMTQDSYCVDFLNRMSIYANDIANKNEEIFKQIVYIMPGINFDQVWTSEFNTPTTKKSIWIYLNVFYKLALQYKTEQTELEKLKQTMTPEQLMSFNISEARATEKLSSQEQFLRNLTDRELRKELERRKAIKYNTEQAEIEEEDLLNFDPNEGFSYWGMFKRFIGNNKVGGDLNKVIKQGCEMFNVNPDDFDLNKFDFNNLTESFGKIFTPENIEKVKTKMMETISKVQEDINSGKINIDQFKDMVNNLQSQGAEAGEDGEAGGINFSNLVNSDMVNTAMSMAEKLSGQKVTPEQRAQLNNIMQDPSQILNMFSPAQLNQARNANRGNAARDRLKKKLEEKQKKSV